ncbi:MAG: VCBS repeat-containing protein [Pseudomonadota bacterium]
MFFRTLAIVLCAASAAKGDWTITELDRADYPPEIAVETRGDVSLVSKNGLPDGLIAKSWGDIRRAWYEQPTRRYAHAILGDAIEAGALVAYDAAGTRHEVVLPEQQVFEDRYPRIVDLDSDGRNEVVAIRASSTGGGGVAIYGLRDGRLSELAAVPDIGTPNRWLNIAAIEDLNGDGLMEIAFVKTPHIGGTLRVFSYRDGALRLLDEERGFSNHAIGDREMRLSAIMDADGDGRLDVAVPDAERRALRIMALDGDELREIASIATPRRIASAILVEDRGFVLRLNDGSVWRIAKE